VLLQDRMKKGRERLDEALEVLELLCEPVEPPKGPLEHIRYFCGNTEIALDLQEREPQRVALYKAAAAPGFAVSRHTWLFGYGTSD
jgi:type I restriction enzyme R subunit